MFSEYIPRVMAQINSFMPPADGVMTWAAPRCRSHCAKVAAVLEEEVDRLGWWNDSLASLTSRQDRAFTNFRRTLSSPAAD